MYSSRPFVTVIVLSTVVMTVTSVIFDTALEFLLVFPNIRNICCIHRPMLRPMEAASLHCVPEVP